MDNINTRSGSLTSLLLQILQELAAVYLPMTSLIAVETLRFGAGTRLELSIGLRLVRVLNLSFAFALSLSFSFFL